eukprot:5276564-Pleurochrysis_carterae.AAC.1
MRGQGAERRERRGSARMTRTAEMEEARARPLAFDLQMAGQAAGFLGGPRQLRQNRLMQGWHTSVSES